MGALLACLGTVAPPAPAGSPGAAAAVRPDVLNIVLDDMRDQTPAQIRAYMPKTVSWMSAGRFYSAAEVSTPSCCPSRAAGMTGRYDHNNGMMHQADIPNLDLTTTVQHRLHAAGYQTGLVGKFLHDWPLGRTPPDFDRFAMWQSSAYRNPPANVQGTVSTLSGYATTLTGNLALQHLRAMAADPQKRPWYEYVAFHAPHRDDTGSFVPDTPYATAPVPACGLKQPGEPDLTDKPPYATFLKITDAEVQRTCQGQMRVLMSVDDQIDRLMRYLQTSGQLANTLVILWSDNGMLWGEHNRVSKFLPYTPAIAVPLWLRWDGHVAVGTSTRLASNVDLAPTIYQATGVTGPPGVTLDGHSLLGSVRRTVQLNEYWLDLANNQIPTWAELHDGHFAYVETYDTTGARVFQEYYDLDADPGQLTNLLRNGTTADDPPAATITALATRLRAARTCAGATCP